MVLGFRIQRNKHSKQEYRLFREDEKRDYVLTVDRLNKVKRFLEGSLFLYGPNAALLFIGGLKK